MNKVVKWVMDNALISVGLIAVAAIIASAYQAGEISATDYRMLADSWPQAHANVKAHIKQAITDGTISKWAYRDLFKETMDDLGSIAIDPASGTVDQERAKLQQLVDKG